MKHRIIAINLPQFHPFKENDEWWGKGFTEWTNVAKARPRYYKHYQPHLPSDTGFYDLRLPETRQMQADMAKEYGIYGFCYYHYWFNGKMLMEKPINDILKSGKPDFPFMFCWANENWTRNWDGAFKKVLIEQKYSEDDDKNHIRWLCQNVFTDKRYIRISNKPVFAVYRIELFPDFKRTVEVWRKVAREEFGMELYIMNAEYPLSPKGNDIQKYYGIDASFGFALNTWSGVNECWYRGLIRRNAYRLRLTKINAIKKWIDKIPYIYDYAQCVNKRIQDPLPNYRCYPSITPSWDNSSRREGMGFISIENSSPNLFGKWLRYVLNHFIPYSEEENFVFINAWNEWAEGNHLEPDQRWGRGYLDVVKKAIADDSV